MISFSSFLLQPLVWQPQIASREKKKIKKIVNKPLTLDEPPAVEARGVEKPFVEKTQHPGHIIRLEGSRSTTPAAFGNAQNPTTLRAGEKLCNFGERSSRASTGNCLGAAAAGQRGKPGQAAACSHITHPTTKPAPRSFMFFPGFSQPFSSKAMEQGESGSSCPKTEG